MTIRDEDLRNQRLIFYEKHIIRIKEISARFLEKSKSRAAMLVDKEGHLVHSEGQASVDPETISALVAASFAATQQIAKLLGEDEFSVLFHQGKKESIHLSLVGARTLLVVVFDGNTTPGMVRLYSDQAVKKLNDLIEEVKKEEPAEGPIVADNFAASAEENLDELFGE